MKEKFTMLRVFLLLLLLPTGLFAQTRIGFQYGMQPVDVVNDNEGNYYLLTRYNVQIFNAQGEFVSKFTVPKVGQYDIELSGIEVDDSKNIFVVDAQNAKVFAFGSDGILKYSFGEFGNASGKLYLPSDIALGEDGNIYLANSGRKAISVFTNAGVFVKEIGSDGTGDGQFSSIERVAVSASGNIYGVDWYSGKVQVFNQTGNFLFSFGSNGTAQGQFKNFPKGIAVDSNSGRIFVCEPRSNRVNIFDITGNYVSEFSSPAQYINFNGSNLVVAEEPDRIRNISMDGTELSIVGGKSSLPGNVNGIKGLAYDSDGNLYVADGNNYRIQVFDSQGHFLRAFGSKGSEDIQFTGLNGLAIDKNNMLYVIDNNKIKIFTKEGVFVRKFGKEGYAYDAFFNPFDIAVDDDGKIYVADRDNRRMQIYSNEGVFIRTNSYIADYALSVGVDRSGNSYLGVGHFEGVYIMVFNANGDRSGELNAYISGIKAPTGLEISDDIIYVRDVSYVYKYDRNTLAFISRHGVQGDSPGEFTRGLEYANHRIALNKEETVLAVSDGLCVQLFPLNNTISLLPIPVKYVGDAEFELPLNSSAGLPISYSTNDPTVASVTGNKVTIKKAGTVSVIANQTGNVLTPVAQQVAQDLVILKKDQTINFQLSKSVELKELSLPLTAEANSGLAVAYRVDDPSIAQIENGKLLLLKEGLVKVIASQPGNEKYNAATEVEREISIVKSEQAITFQTLPGKTFGNAPFTVQALASSDLPVALSSSNPEVATITDNVIMIVKAGVTTITATQGGNNYYLAATPVEQKLFVSKALQEILFMDIPHQEFDKGTFKLAATATSGLPITYIGSHPEVASISGNTVTFHKPGTIAIAANQAGNENYEAATQVAKTLTILKKNQTITFSPLMDRILGEAPFSLSATSDAGLPVFYESSNTHVATIEGNIVTLQGAGTTIITARQEGNNTFESASSEQTLVVTLVTVAEDALRTSMVVYPNPTKDKITVVLKDKEKAATLSLVNTNGRTVAVDWKQKEKGVYEASVAFLSAGVYVIHVQMNTAVHSLKFVKE